jgi:hypothetical protein
MRSKNEKAVKAQFNSSDPDKFTKLLYKDCQMKTWLRNSRHIELFFFSLKGNAYFWQVRAGSFKAKRVLHETLQIKNLGNNIIVLVQEDLQAYTSCILCTSSIRLLQ